MNPKISSFFTSHENYTFEENLERLVEATNNIVPTGKRFEPSEEQIECIKSSPQRAIMFLKSAEFDILARTARSCGSSGDGNHYCCFHKKC